VPLVLPKAVLFVYDQGEDTRPRESKGVVVTLTENSPENANVYNRTHMTCMFRVPELHVVQCHWRCLKVDSHIVCRVHAAPVPFHCHAVPLIHTCHAAHLPYSDSAVYFMKVRVVARNTRTAVQQFNRPSVL